MDTPDPQENPLPRPGPGAFRIRVTHEAAKLSCLYIGFTIPLVILCLIVLSSRLYVRSRPKWNIGWDDGCILVGTMLAILDWAMLFSELTPKPGFLPLEDFSAAIKLAFWAVPIWALSMSLIKAGITLTLLRIRQSRSWKIFLYFILAVQVIFGIHNVIFVLIQCIPLEAAYNPRVKGRCFPPVAIRTASIMSSVVNIVTDVLLSAAPITFLVNLRKSRIERALLILLMSLGLLASAASIRKALYVNRFGKQTKDIWALTISIGAWTSIEQLLAALAASAVCFKAVLCRVFPRIGIMLHAEPKLETKIISEPSTPVHDVPHAIHLQTAKERKQQPRVSVQESA